MIYNKKYELYLNRFNENLSRFLSNLDNNSPDLIKESISYAVSNGGKRIRPVLCYATADMLNINLDQVDEFALAIEFIHSYSLVHDDLPSMDNDDYRRGKLATHKKFGEAFGILAGDALLNLAFEVCLSKNNFSNNDAKSCQILFDYSGYKGMIAGQVLDLQAEKENFSNYSKEEQIVFLNNIFLNKTSKLLTVPLLIASIQGNYKYFNELKEFGEKLGVMFQITDDILDVEGSFETIGKTPNKDKDANKLTAVKIYGLEGAKEKASQLYISCKEIINGFENNEFLAEFIDKIYYRKK